MSDQSVRHGGIYASILHQKEELARDTIGYTVVVIPIWISAETINQLDQPDNKVGMAISAEI
jgi:hypothetical protein